VGGRQGQTVTETSRAERTAAGLKAAARRLLTRKSYADIRITDITEEAGRAAGSFYRYFTDKDDLLRALVADFESAVSGQVEDMLGGPDHGLTDREDVRKHVEAYWTSYRTHHAEMSGLFQAAAVSDEFRAIHLRLREHQVDVWTAHLAQNDPAPADPRLAALGVVCLLEYFCYELMHYGEPAPDDRAAIAALTDLVARGVLGG